MQVKHRPYAMLYLLHSFYGVKGNWSENLKITDHWEEWNDYEIHLNSSALNVNHSQKSVQLKHQ